MDDRRIFSRINVKFQVKFLNLSTDRVGEAETIDISANGVGFITEEALAMNTPLEMWLVIPDHHEPLHALGDVVWADAMDKIDQKRVGVQMRNGDLIGLARALWVREQT